MVGAGGVAGALVEAYRGGFPGIDVAIWNRTPAAPRRSPRGAARDASPISRPPSRPPTRGHRHDPATRR